MANRTDANHVKISNILRCIGWKVRNTSMVGNGFPDTVCSKNGRGNELVEIKTEDGMLTKAQIKFILEWDSSVYVLRNVDDCVAFNEDLLTPYTPSAKEIKSLELIK